ncbi:MAG: riboflavin synthase [Candidatus Eremiobacteraeota bacterium]|nr:riboflavin synthase [Candidatus Eremiobacteraeota bacterium]
MFGGLIAHLGNVAALEADPRGGVRLRVRAPRAAAEGIELGDSIAVNGVCLTVVAYDDGSLSFDVVPETLERSALGALVVEAPVNVELSLRLGDRLGGHLVYGHVDATARILDKRSEGQGHRLTVELPPSIAPFIVDKGYVAVDGVSLTVAKALEDRFEIALIPETSARTTLGFKGIRDLVNLEIDPVARYALGAADRYARGARPSSDELAWAYEI